MKKVLIWLLRLYLPAKIDETTPIVLFLVSVCSNSVVTKVLELHDTRGYIIGMLVVWPLVRKVGFFALILFVWLGMLSSNPELLAGRSFPMRTLCRLAIQVRKPANYQHVGYRYARFHCVADTLLLSGIVYYQVFSGSEQARCHKESDVHRLFLRNHSRRQTHQAPHPDCTCGWYSRKSLGSLALMFKANTIGGYRHRACILEASYSGHIIPGTKGSRAEHQRILRLWIPKKCSAPRCHTNANHLAHNLVNGRFMVAPFCSTHAAQAPQSWSLADIRSEFQCEVYFV